MPPSYRRNKIALEAPPPKVGDSGGSMARPGLAGKPALAQCQPKLDPSPRSRPGMQPTPIATTMSLSRCLKKQRQTDTATPPKADAAPWPKKTTPPSLLHELARHGIDLWRLPRLHAHQVLQHCMQVLLGVLPRQAPLAPWRGHPTAASLQRLTISTSIPARANHPPLPSPNAPDCRVPPASSH